MSRRLLHKQKRSLLETNIATLCRKFKPHEMEEHVLPIFHKATWGQVLYLLKRNKKTITSAHIALALITVVKCEPFAFLEDMYFELFLTHKAVHSKNYTWNAFEMFGGVGQAGLVTASKICEALKNSFRSLGYLPTIKVKLFGAFSWIMILQKKRKHSDSKSEQPFLLAYIPGEPYFFTSRKMIKTDISDGLLLFMGHRRFEDCNLSASDIASMVTLLRNRAAKAFDAHSAQNTIAPYTPGPGVATEDGMDFTDEHLKINYANMVFGKDCPVVKKITLRELGPIVSKKQTYRTSMTIQSKNVFKSLKAALVRGVFVLPLSPFIERLITSGKNCITINNTNESM